MKEGNIGAYRELLLVDSHIHANAIQLARPKMGIAKVLSFNRHHLILIKATDGMSLRVSTRLFSSLLSVYTYRYIRLKCLQWFYVE